MSATAQPHREAISTRVVRVGPSPIARWVIGPLTRLLNPLVGVLAGRRYVPMAAQVHHVGRRSGKRYVTPTSAHLAGEIILIPLTFGNQSDWARNVGAAGQCSVQLNGKRYEAAQPQFLDAAEARPLVRQAFNPVERFGFRLLGIKQFLRLRVIG